MTEVISVDLNLQQREAVEHPGGPMLVLAGAGSGKTRVLACRAAFLVHSVGVPPYRILALTFTNKAAAELRSRVVNMVGEEGQMVVAGTFHSILARIMRREGLNIGIDPHFTIVNSDDRRRMIKLILKEHDIPTDQAAPAQVERMISNAKISLLDAEEFSSRAIYPFQKIVAAVYPIYEERLKRMSGLDFDDLLSRPLLLFKKYPEFLQRLRQRFQHVLVDEFQDTNKAQYSLVREIAREHRNLYVVGDDDQSIYGFRGATLSNILDFQKDWQDVRVIRLEQNYRSTKPILDVAWSVIKRNRYRHSKKLWTDKKNGFPVRIISTQNDEGEAMKVVGLIQQQHQSNGYKLDMMAILYRTNAQSLPFERALRALQIPYRILGGLKFYERKEVKDVLAYLRLLVNPADDVSFNRIVNYPPRGIGAELQSQVMLIARKKSIPLYQAALLKSTDTELSERRRKSLTGFIAMVEDFRKLRSEVNISDHAVDVVARTGLRERLTVEEKEDPSRAESKIANLDSLLRDIARFSASNPSAGLEIFLEEVALVTEVDENDENVERVNLATLHGSKGLEFPVVYMCGLEEGLLPMKPPDGSEADVEEERRLFYVGATRAKERLTLVYCVGRSRWGSTQWMGPSRFIREIPPDLVVNETIPTVSAFALSGNDRSKPIRRRIRHDSPEHPSVSAEDLHRGILVKHPKFGLGVVTDIKRKVRDTIAEVDFDDAGVKTLVLKYAKLEVVR